MENILPCPFCSHEVEARAILGGINSFLCPKCGLVASFRGCETRQEAIDAWDLRADSITEEV